MIVMVHLDKEHAVYPVKSSARPSCKNEQYLHGRHTEANEQGPERVVETREETHCLH